MDIEKFLSADTDKLRSIDFSIGMPLLMVVDGIKAHLKSVIIGAKPGEYLITTIPRHNGIEGHLVNGHNVKVVYMFSGTVFAFISEILNSIDDYPPHLVINYPKVVERQELRASDRIQCFIPARIQCGGGEIDCVILDLSSGGCCLAIKADKEDSGEIEPGAEINVCFCLSGMKSDCTCLGEVRRVDQAKRRHSLGIQFKDTDEKLRGQIQDFVKEWAHFA